MRLGALPGEKPAIFFSPPRPVLSFHAQFDTLCYSPCLSVSPVR